MSNKSSEAFVIEFGESKKKKGKSLQDLFIKYKKKRQKEIRKARKRREVPDETRLRAMADPERMWALRMKFIDQCKKYFGIPYAKKYWTPQDSEYYSPIFLDCCGLVRRVMRDLSKDFGFKIGPWNQSYQSDTLPIIIESEADMQPGDLVFISATYNNPKMKKQKHDMTHVEIWLGDGPKTIGARWQKGKVQVFESYKFEAKSYHSPTYIFKSIDTWLMGICRSHCEEHKWLHRVDEYIEKRRRLIEAAKDHKPTFQPVSSHCPQHTWKTRSQKFKPSKKSVFAEKSRNQQGAAAARQAEHQDQSAGDTDDELLPLQAESCEASNSEDPAVIPVGNSIFYDENDDEENGSDDSSDDSSDDYDAIISVGSVGASAAVAEIETVGAYASNWDAASGFDEIEYLRCMESDIDASENDSDDEINDSAAAASGSNDDVSASENNAFVHRNGDNLQSEIICCKAKCRTPKPQESGETGCVDKKPTMTTTKSIEHQECQEMGVPANIIFDDDENIGRANTPYKGNRLTFLSLLKYSVHNRKSILMPDAFSDLAVTGKSIEKSNERELGSQLPPKKFSSAAELATESCNKIKNEKGRPLSAPSTSDTSVQSSMSSRGNDSEKYWSCDSKCLNANNSNNLEDSDDSQKADKKSQPNRVAASQENSNQAQPDGRQPLLVKALTKEACWTNPAGVSESNDQAQQSSSEASSPDVKSARPGQSQSQGQNNGEGQQRLGDQRSPEPPRSPPRIRASLLQGKDPTFYIGGGNGVALVEGPLLEMGWKRITDKYDNFFRLKWVESKSRINYNAFREGEQMVNHIPNCNLLTNKLGLLQTLQSHERVNMGIRGRDPRFKVNDLLPETYCLDDPRDREAFYDNHQDGEVWICKPVGLNQGKGIYLVRDVEELKRQLLENEDKNLNKKPHRPIMTRIIQRYIRNPLLLHGKKFDIRAYMLIASTVPYLVLFHNGYARLCMGEYDINNHDLLTHLTNQFVQKRDPARYKEEKDNTVWSMAKLNDYINENVASDLSLDKDWVYNILTSRMKAMMLHCFQAVKHKLQAKVGFFELYGFDFLIDSNMKVWLIEINVNPCLATNCDALKEVVPGVVRESLYLSIECFEKAKRCQPLMPLQNLRQFQVLYNGANKTVYIPPLAARSPSGSGPSSGQDAGTQSPTRRSKSASPVKESVNERQANEGKNSGATQMIDSSQTNREIAQEQKNKQNKKNSTGQSEDIIRMQPLKFTPRVTPRATSTVMSQSGTPATRSLMNDRTTLSPKIASTEDIKFKMRHGGLEFTQGNEPTRPFSRNIANISSMLPKNSGTPGNSDATVSQALSKPKSGSKARPISNFLSKRSIVENRSKKHKSPDLERVERSLRRHSTRSHHSNESLNGTLSPTIVNFPDANSPLKQDVTDEDQSSISLPVGANSNISFPTSPVLIAHSIQTPGMALDGSRCALSLSSTPTGEQRGN